MSKNIYAVLKWLLSLGSVVGLLLFYRTVPLVGEGSLEGLTRFNIVTTVVGLICIAVFVIAIRSEKASGRKLSSAEKGANGVLIAMALIFLELGIFSMVGVNMDKNKDPQIVSMRNCYVGETNVVNHMRGIDSLLYCTDPSGAETIFPLDKETAEKLGTEKQNLTIEFYDNVNRIIRYY